MKSPLPTRFWSKVTALRKASPCHSSYPTQKSKRFTRSSNLNTSTGVPSVSATGALLVHFLIFAHFPSAKAWRGFHRLICLIFVEHLLLFFGCWRCTGREDAATAFEELIFWVGDRLDIVDHYTLAEES